MPFELLVGIVMMIAVITLAFIVMEQINDQICEEKVAFKLNDFKSNIENVANKSEGAVDKFSWLPGAELGECSIANRGIRIKEYTGSICEARCDQHQCLILEEYFKDTGITAPGDSVCIKINFYTQFPEDTQICNAPPEGFSEVVNLRSEAGIREGTYALQKIFNPYSPTICAYYRR